MRLKFTCGALVAAVAMWLGASGLAAAASSPTLKISGASSVTSSSAVIGASINPNGARTTYDFSYGPTSALGTTSPMETLGAGTKTVGVSYSLASLQSGTTYYYNLTAQSAAGTVTTKTVTFTTAGPPPAQATTGAAQMVNASSATLTGVVQPNSAETTYYFEIGNASGSYQLQTAPLTVPAGTTPVPVSVNVSGLEAGTTFHFALIATHGGMNTSAGADATFETYPDPAPTPKVTQATSPKSESGGPFVFKTVGQVQNSTVTPDSLACTGTATVSFYYGKHRILRQLAPLTATCGFSATTTFRSLPIKHKKSEQLLVYIRFDGNGYLRAVSLKAEKITLG
jgi:hypothetical protein